MEKGKRAVHMMEHASDEVKGTMEGLTRWSARDGNCCGRIRLKLQGRESWRGTSKIICSRSGALVHGPSAGLLTACLSDWYLSASFCLAHDRFHSAQQHPEVCLEALLQRPKAPGGKIAVNWCAWFSASGLLEMTCPPFLINIKTSQYLQ